MYDLPIGLKLRIAAIALLVLPAAFALSWNLKAHAGELTGSSADCANNGVHPSPYTGGAGVSRIFYPADGSTVTVTTTGAVIKQSPCGTPYREGWINPADMNCVNTFDDLSGRMQPGTTNPFINSGTSCSQASTTSTVTTPATTASSTPAVTKAAATTTTTTTTSSGKAATLPNTGPGNVLALGGISSVLAGIGHFVYRTRRLNT